MSPAAGPSTVRAGADRVNARRKREVTVPNVAIVTDSTSDLQPERAAELGIRVVPLLVRFGTQEFRSGVDLSTADFWTRMLAPDAPFPTTAAPTPGAFAEAFADAFAAGAESVVCVTIGSRMSATFASAEIAAKEHPGREIHVVDSTSVSMGVGHLVMLGVELAAAGRTGAAIAATLRERAADVDLYVAFDTLEYVRRGGRLSPARAAIGTMLSVKPIITVVDGVVETADRVRTRAKARERVAELLTARPVERIAIIDVFADDIEAFRDMVVGRLPGGVDPAYVSVNLVGPSVGPHVGPGAVGGVVLLKR
jgi:DegV family protein with EDD domain